jgi:hypothetical protein
LNETHTFLCNSCKKRVTLEAAVRSDAREIMKKSGWTLKIGGYRSMVIGSWTRPECQGKERRGNGE